MTLSLRANFIPYELDVPVTITSSDFFGSEILENNRQILPIILTISHEDIDNKYWRYEVKMNNITTGIRIPVVPGNAIENNGSDFLIIPEKGISVGLDPDLNPYSYINSAVAFYIILDEPNIDKCLYKTQDIYRFYNNLGSLQMSILFERLKLYNDNIRCESKTKLNIKNTMIIPSIDIKLQSLIDGSDIGNTFFTIIDDYTYCDKKTTPIIKNNNCKILTSDCPKKTIFDKPCPSIVSILQGRGKTAWDKIKYLFDNNKANVNDIYDFTLNIFKYAMLKYILSRLMYGTFNINYILNKYNDIFLRNLKNTRFCNFVKEFIDPNSNIYNYDKYFL